MKSNPKSRLILLITLGILFAFSPIISKDISYKVGGNNKSSEFCEDFKLDNESLKISAVSGKIHIGNNWSDAKTAGICTGLGTYSDPYVIEDLVIDGGGLGYSILIEDSDEYFKIENCTIYNSLGGIKLDWADNGQIINNEVNNNNYGMYLCYSVNSTISGNSVNNNIQIGILFYFCYNSTISENTVDNSSDGIYFYHGAHNTISGNTASNNDYGIRLYGLNTHKYSRILGNTANDNDYGIYLKYSDDNAISGNTVNNNHYGICLHNCMYNTISLNTVNYNDYGINLGTNLGPSLTCSNNNNVSGNTLLGNGECIIVGDDCVGNLIENNDCDSGDGGDGGGGGVDGTIPGYNLFFLLGVVSVVLIVIHKKLKK